MAAKNVAIVHYPARNGPVCGNLDKRGRIKRPIPTDARSYSVDPDKVTCEVCTEYLEGLGGHLHSAGLEARGASTPRETPASRRDK